MKLMACIVILAPFLCLAQGRDPLQGIPTGSTLLNDAYDTLTSKNISYWLSNNGTFAHNGGTGRSGFEWPRGSGKHLMFWETVIIGGKVEGETRVSGSPFRIGFQAGPILANGQPADPTDPSHRIYRARRTNSSIFHRLPQEEQSRLRTDFMAWPALLGAPWVDRNSNGVYDPNFDAWLADTAASDSPVFVGEHLAWTVSNDMDSVRTYSVYGSKPLGIEVQTLLWTSDSTEILPQTIFVRHRIVNKSSKLITGMYIGRWADTNIGDASDDLLGCDTVRDMMYSYNAYLNDAIYGHAPALGTVMVQGPVVPQAGSRAVWDFGFREGFRNLPLTTFTYYDQGGGVYRDPMLGNPAGAQQMYNNLRGLVASGNPQVDASTGRVTTFAVAGDPVTESGWYGARGFWPGDYRSLMSSGPFDMAPGAVQEVVFANLITHGWHGRHEITWLRHNADILRAQHRIASHGILIPELEATVEYPAPATARVAVSGLIPRADSATVLLTRKDGSIHTQFTLYDDGAHGDGNAGDGRFAGSMDLPREAYGVDCLVRVRYDGIESTDWPVQSCLPLAGLLRVADLTVRSDHRNFDGRVNPGENVRFSMKLENASASTLGPFRIVYNQDATLRYPALKVQDTVAAGAEFTVPYIKDKTSSFVSVDVPANARGGDVFDITFGMADTSNQCWCDTLRIPIEDFIEAPFDSLAVHASGRAFGTLGWRVTDRSALRNHTYRITVQRKDTMDAQATISIFDLVTGDTLLARQPLPDWQAHDIPATDGWKLTAGTSKNFPVRWEREDQSYIDVATQYTPSNVWLEQTVGMETGSQWDWGTTVRWWDQLPVRIVFDPIRTQKAFMYLRGGSPSYGYMGYFRVPFTVWDVSDSARPRQLNVGFVEQKDGPRQNNTWDPITQLDREYLFIFGSTYSDAPQSKYTLQPIFAGAHDLDIQYAGWLYRDTTAGPIPAGFTIDLTPFIPVSSRDTFYVNPKGPVGVRPVPGQISAFEILSVHPNPVTAGTTARVILQSGASGIYSMRLVDILGRNVRTISPSEFTPGSHIVDLPIPRNAHSGLYHLVVGSGDATRSIPITVIR